MSDSRKGWKYTLETKRKISEAHKSGKAYNWKGDNVGYSALHKWVKRELGKPKQCVVCGTLNEIMHWANRDHKYRRNLNDWIALCYYCHDKYDRENNGKYSKKKY